MFRKTLLALMVMVGFASAPQKSQASIPVEEIVEGAKAAKKIYGAVKPLIKPCGKAIKKVGTKVVNYIKKRRSHRSDDVYVSPARTAAAANEDEYEVIVRRRYGHGEIDVDIDGERL